MNYRSVVVLGTATLVEGDEKVGAVGERRLPQGVRLVEPVGRDPQPDVHLAPVRDVVPAVRHLVEWQAEGGHDRRVGDVERAERIDECAVPIEEDRFHQPMLSRTGARASS